MEAGARAAALLRALLAAAVAVSACAAVESVIATGDLFAGLLSAAATVLPMLLVTGGALAVGAAAVRSVRLLARGQHPH